MKIDKVYHWSNNLVMVFDKNGEQITNLQGMYLDVRDKILEACDENVQFFRADWGVGEKQISRNLF